MKKKAACATLVLLLFTLPVSGKEFLNTFLHINLGAIWNAGSFGPVIDREKATALSKDKSDTFNYGKPSFLHTSINFSLDIAPFRPLVLGYEAHAIKIGLRGGMKFHNFREMIDVTDNGNDKTYSATLMSYYEGSVGLVIRYAPAIDITGIQGSYSADKGLVFYALYGRLFKGTLNTFAAKNAYENSLPEGEGEPVEDNSTAMTGHKLEIGTGGEIAVWSINLGLSVSYALVFLNLEADRYGDLGTKTKLHEINIGFYISLPVEYHL